jgi:hypothetical protein
VIDKFLVHSDETETTMNALKKTALTVSLGVAGLLAAGAASATAELDFTSDVWLDGSETVNIDGVDVNVTLSSLPGGSTLVFENDGTQIGNTTSFLGGPLAEDFDGIGVNDDEVNGDEQLIVDFGGQLLFVDGGSFLDLFAAANGDQEEISLKFFVGGLEVGSPETFFGESVFPADGGWYSRTFTPVAADEVRVVFIGGNDNVGVGDAALAALRVQVVPIPAAAWLFGSALVGMVGMGRRKLKKA